MKKDDFIYAWSDVGSNKFTHVLLTGTPAHRKVMDHRQQCSRTKSAPRRREQCGRGK